MNGNIPMAGFRDVEMDKDIIGNICGEGWKVLELKMEREDYEQRKKCRGYRAIQLEETLGV